MKKTLIGVLIAVLILVAIVAIVGLFYLGTIVKIGIEQVGPQMTKVAVNVDSVSVSVLTGSASIKNLVVGNPQGFSSPQAISVGNVAVSLDPMSVTSSKILIHSVKVDSPEITFQEALGGSNLSKILSNVNSSAKNPNAPENGGTTSSGKPAPKIEIDDFLITNAKVNVVIAGVGSKVVPLPEIHLTDLGKDGNGLSPVELTRAILTSIVTATAKTVASSAGNIGQAVSGLSSSIGNLFSK